MKQRGFAFLPFLLANWQLIAIAFAVVFALKWFGDFKEGLVERGREEVRGQWAKAAEVARKNRAVKVNNASENVEKGNAKDRIKYQTITKTVDRYIDREVYRNICFDADGLRDANAALSRDGTPPGKPDKPLPGPNTSLRWERSIGLAKSN